MVHVINKHFLGYTDSANQGVRHIRHVIDFDDLIQEGQLAVLRALKKYDKNHGSGASIKSYMYKVIKQSLTSYIIRHSSPIAIKTKKGFGKMSENDRDAVFTAQRIKLFSDNCPDTWMAIKGSDPELKYEVEAKDYFQWIVRKMSEVLTDRERQVVHMRILGYTYKRISAELIVSQATAKRSFKSAIAKAREAIGVGH